MGLKSGVLGAAVRPTVCVVGVNWGGLISLATTLFIVCRPWFLRLNRSKTFRLLRCCKRSGLESQYSIWVWCFQDLASSIVECGCLSIHLLLYRSLSSCLYSEILTQRSMPTTPRLSTPPRNSEPAHSIPYSNFLSSRQSTSNSSQLFQCVPIMYLLFSTSILFLSRQFFISVLQMH